MHGFLEVDRVENTKLITSCDQHLAALNDQRPLGIGDDQRGSLRLCALHDVGLDKKSGLAGARATNNKHIAIACVARGFGAAVHRQAFGFCEDHVIPGVWINKRCDIRMRAPSG